jgi:hypothetical protein
VATCIIHPTSMCMDVAVSIYAPSAVWIILGYVKLEAGPS